MTTALKAPSQDGRPFRVLTLDGGGMRGLYTASLLQGLSSRFAQQRGVMDLDIGKGYDLIAGTSTGGILACALAFGLPISRIVDLYRNEGPKIFLDPMPSAAEKWSFFRWCVRNRGAAANRNDNLRAALAQLFGATTIEELYRTRGIAVCIPSVLMLKERARIFKTPHNKQKQLDNGYSIINVCLATSAAPIFLPLVAVDWPGDPMRFDVFADGGLWANNPVLVGLIEALEMCPPNRPIEILSIGTCAAPEGTIFDKKEVDFGLRGWRAGAKALSVSMNAQASGSDFMATLLASHLTKLGHQVKVVRLPESAPSEEQMKYLRLDLASPKALQAFSSLGADDGVAAYRLCQDAQNEEGKTISGMFGSMPELKQGGVSNV